MDPPFDPDRHYTVDEYLAYELSAEWRYDFYNGRIRPKMESNWEQASIISNLIGALHGRLDDTPVRAFDGFLRVAVDPPRCFLHPDLSIVDRNTPRLMPPTDNVSFLEPRALVEVYSAESEADDRGDRFARYRQIESVQEYVLVAESEPRAETFHRQPDGVWAIGPIVTGMDGVIPLRSLGIEVPMADVYDRVEFPVSVDDRPR